MLYVEVIRVSWKRMVEISRLLKARLDRTFYKKDLGVTKQILGMELHRDGKNGKLWLSQ